MGAKVIVLEDLQGSRVYRKYKYCFQQALAAQKIFDRNHVVNYIRKYNKTPYVTTSRDNSEAQSKAFEEKMEALANKQSQLTISPAMIGYTDKIRDYLQNGNLKMKQLNHSSDIKNIKSSSE